MRAGKLERPLGHEVWQQTLRKGRGRGPIRNSRLMADCLGRVLCEEGWQQGEQIFLLGTDLKTQWDSDLVP
eukprot:3577259-Amphidinium_carterae.1